MKCNICNKHKATSYDYRFIESYGLQVGKVVGKRNETGN